MNEGRIEQSGTSQELYDLPRTPIVRDFVGNTVLARGRIVEVTAEHEVRVALDHVPQSIVRSQSSVFSRDSIGQAVYVAIRPEAIAVEPYDGKQGNPAQENKLTGSIRTLLFVGDRYECGIQLGTENLSLYLPRGYDWQEEQQVTLSFPKEALSLWPAQPHRISP